MRAVEAEAAAAHAMVEDAVVAGTRVAVGFQHHRKIIPDGIAYCYHFPGLGVVDVPGAVGQNRVSRRRHDLHEVVPALFFPVGVDVDALLVVGQPGPGALVAGIAEVPVHLAVAVAVLVGQPGTVPLHQQIVVCVGLAPRRVFVRVAVLAVEDVCLVVVSPLVEAGVQNRAVAAEDRAALDGGAGLLSQHAGGGTG